MTYEAFAKAWQSMTDEAGFADRMNSLPKYVASTTLQEAEWNSSVIKGDVTKEVAKLKQQPGQDLLVAGSGQLVRTLMQHDLVDEYRFMVHPVVIGRGTRLFDEESNKTALQLVDHVTFDSGVVILTYHPAQKKAGGR